MTRPVPRPWLAAAILLLAGCATARRPAPARAAAGAAARPGWSVRAVEVAGHGRLLLSLPPGWVVSDAQGEAAGVTLSQPGARFRVLLSPMWNPGEPESPQARADSAQLFAELARREALAGSVEREIPLEELVGPGVRGAYFSATDRSLVGRETRADEFRHVLQGAAAVGPVILAFTLLDDGPGAWRGDLLEVIRTARHAPDGGGHEDDALEALPGVVTEPLRVQLPDRSWAVLIDLPGFEVARVAPARMGHDTAHVIARSAEADIVASAILSPAGTAPDAAACRERALARLQASVPGIQELKRAEGGGSAAATYVFRPDGAEAPELHAHAFRWRDGTCIGVHVSKADPAPEDVRRLDAILSSVRIAEDL